MRKARHANWNVIGLTDLGGSLVERHVYRPYGEVTVNQETSYGDRDGDGDVDATDKGTPGTDCTGTVSGALELHGIPRKMSLTVSGVLSDGTAFAASDCFVIQGRR
jgi:hypothetical protein